jgi:hypothetical protein
VPALPPFRLQREAPSQSGENNKREKASAQSGEETKAAQCCGSSGLKLKLRHGSFMWSCRGGNKKKSQSGACEVTAKARRSIAAGSPGRQIVTVNSVWPSHGRLLDVHLEQALFIRYFVFVLIRFELNFPLSSFKFAVLCHVALPHIREGKMLPFVSLRIGRDETRYGHSNPSCSGMVEGGGTNQKVGSNGGLGTVARSFCDHHGTTAVTDHQPDQTR